MNNDLISREALKKEFTERINANGFMTTEELLGIIDNAPTVTPQALYNGIVELISKNGITTVDELLELLKGGAEE